MAHEDVRLDAIETPEGRAIYPFGSWGAGYLVDDATERRLRAYLARMVWVVVGFCALQSVVGSVAQVSDRVAGAITFVAFLVFHYTFQWTILRHSARSRYRPSSEELLRLRLARGGRTAAVATRWCGLIVCVAIAIGAAVVTGGLERWIIEAACAGVLVLLVAGLRRIQRIPD